MSPARHNKPFLREHEERALLFDRKSAKKCSFLAEKNEIIFARTPPKQAESREPCSSLYFLTDSIFLT